MLSSQNGFAYLSLNMLNTTECLTKKKRRSKCSKTNEKKQGRPNIERNIDIIFKQKTAFSMAGFTGETETRAGCWENTKKACKSRAVGE